MCLYVTSLKKKRLKFIDGKITCYKVLQYNPATNKLRSEVRWFPYKAGYTKAQGELTIHNSNSYQYINGGAIHVYTSRKVALYDAKDNYVAVIEVTCLEKDLIAEGTGSEAAFKKIFIPRENYQKCLKLAKKRYLTYQKQNA